jgi:uncharacterized protein YndB with AHSA1/START domain
MPDACFLFTVNAAPEKVFDAVASPDGISTWWSRKTDGKPNLGNIYTLDFGGGYIWRAEVTRCVKNSEFELTMIESMDDWLGSKVGFDLAAGEGNTSVDFVHSGWAGADEHYRSSCYCWAMYLRLMKKYVETGNIVAYGERLDA